jgi:peptide chain release factor 3
VAAHAAHGDAWETAVEEHELLDADGAVHDEVEFLAGNTTPLMFASAILNFGVAQLLDTLVALAPAPHGTTDRDGGVREVDDPFSAFVFKVQAGMDTAHRDRLAFARVCSGVFRRGMVATHAESGRPFATKYAQSVFGRERTVLDTAYPGDIIGLVNASALRVGDTIFEDRPVAFPPIASFAPEHFMSVRAADSGRYKQFRRGIEQLDQEGVVQVLRSEVRGDQAPVLAAVGPMQFEVASARMESEFNAPIRMSRLDYSHARLTNREQAAEVNDLRGVEVLTRSDGALLALFPDRWRAEAVERQHPHLLLERLVAGER